MNSHECVRSRIHSTIHDGAAALTPKVVPVSGLCRLEDDMVGSVWNMPAQSVGLPATYAGDM
jgi:hypothetical protein